VTSRDAEAGTTVVAGQAVLRLIEPASLWVKARFDQGRSAGLAVGLRARIVLRSDPARPLAGRVVRVESVSDSVTEERMAEIAFDSLPASVSVGELAEVTLALAPTAAALLLPNASIQRPAERAGGPAGEQTGVWRVDGSTLHFTPVHLGQASLDGQVQILDGLKAGDTVVVFSERALAADSRIRTVPALTGPAP
jgi:HlyD family secretion protein